MINLTPRKQLVMGPRVYEAALIHDKNAVGAHGGGDALRHDDLRFPRDLSVERGAQVLLR